MRGPGFVPLCGPPPGLFRIERWDCYVVSPMENQGGAFVTKRPHQNAAIFFDARRRSSANYFENRDKPVRQVRSAETRCGPQPRKSTLPSPPRYAPVFQCMIILFPQYFRHSRQWLAVTFKQLAKRSSWSMVDVGCLRRLRKIRIAIGLRLMFFLRQVWTAILAPLPDKYRGPSKKAWP